MCTRVHLKAGSRQKSAPITVILLALLACLQMHIPGILSNSRYGGLFFFPSVVKIK